LKQDKAVLEEQNQLLNETRERLEIRTTTALAEVAQLKRATQEAAVQLQTMQARIMQTEQVAEESVSAKQKEITSLAGRVTEVRRKRGETRTVALLIQFSICRLSRLTANWLKNWTMNVLSELNVKCKRNR